MAIVRFQVESERVTSNEPGRIRMYLDDQLVGEVEARVEMKPGADGGMYPCVSFTQIQPSSSTPAT